MPEARSEGGGETRGPGGYSLDASLGKGAHRRACVTPAGEDDVGAVA